MRLIFEFCMAARAEHSLFLKHVPLPFQYRAANHVSLATIPVIDKISELALIASDADNNFFRDTLLEIGRHH